MPAVANNEPGTGWFAAEIQMARHCPIENLTRAPAEKSRIAIDSMEEG
jgi:hypothetical protein